ncbi:MAG TPA: cytochrome b/b6 domain-containing protein [Ensifer sp.]|jgi:thiosulfate reductase cytochrome b subunit|uniref:cytochrome b/b6 domain-containing protein n=1 Tax=Ensifer sp. TaxID=1872086 RepID=UPI002E167F91|nr:cytochrome b/b6 domain-containing protein [Ensifer sp.]
MTTKGNEAHAIESELRADLTIRRHRLATRLTHWMWAAALFFLLLSGLQIFNAHPALYIGQQSGFDFDNSVLSIQPIRDADGSIKGETTVLGRRFDTTGVLGVSGPQEHRSYSAFPAWLTVPSYHDLATGRVVHFFFAWLFATAYVLWLLASLFNGHLGRDIVPGRTDFRALPQTVIDHLRFRFGHDGRYNCLQKLAYAAVLLLFFPLMILTGLTMSPGMNAAWPWLLELFGGRQTARTIHFTVMLLLLAFFAVHLFMVFAAGPINEMRSMITGRYRIDDPHKGGPAR